MRISQLTTDAGFDVFCEITPYLGNIIEDSELLDELRKKLKISDGATTAEIYAVAINKLTKIVPVVFKKHRDDVYGIVAAVNGKEPEDIAKQMFLKTLMDIREIVVDKAFVDFFKSLRNMEEM